MGIARATLDSVSSKTLTVVKFYATWCGPCKQMAPLYQKLASAHPSVTFLEVDVDDDETASLITKFNVTSVPTFVKLQNGKVVFETGDVAELAKQLENERK